MKRKGEKVSWTKETGSGLVYHRVYSMLENLDMFTGLGNLFLVRNILSQYGFSLGEFVTVYHFPLGSQSKMRHFKSRNNFLSSKVD